MILYVVLTALMIMQMLIGVLCSVVDSVTASEKEKKDTASVYERLLKDVKEQDKDGDGNMSRAELMAMVTAPDSLNLMHDLNINVLFFIQLSRVLFPADDMTVSYDELLHLLLACRCDNP